MKHSLAAILFLLISSAVFAQAEPVKEKDKYKGSAELGFVTTSGNTDTSSVNAKVKIEAEYNPWRQTFDIEALNSSDGDDTTAERYLVSNKSDYKLTQKGYVFGYISYEEDKFSGYEYRANESVGYGRKVIDKKEVLVELELGLGARQSRLDAGTNAGAKETEFTTRLAGKLVWKIPPGSVFSENLSAVIGENSTVYKSDMALSVPFIQNLSMKLSYSIIHSTDVPVGIAKTDSAAAVTLVYSF